MEYKIEFKNLEEISERIQYLQGLIKKLKEEKENQIKQIDKQIQKLEAEEKILRDLFNYWKGNFNFVG